MIPEYQVKENQNKKEKQWIPYIDNSSNYKSCKVQDLKKTFSEVENKLHRKMVTNYKVSFWFQEDQVNVILNA